MQIVAPLAIGIGFGFVLQKGRLGHYDTIVNVFRFKDLRVLKFLMSALMVSMLGIQALRSLGLAEEVPVAHSYLVGNLLGGVLFGMGMAVAGFCPGTVAAGAGEGRLDYLIAGSFGLYAGAVLFGLAYPKLMPLLGNLANLGAITAAELFHVDAWLPVLLFWELGLLIFYLIERGPLRPR